MSDKTPDNRSSIRRTAWILVGCALASYLIFLASVWK